jgi:DNA-binding MarR family transcriptional regulator
MAQLLQEALDRQLQRDSDMPHAYYMLLAMLSDADGHSLRMTELAERTNSSQSRVSHAVTRLEQAGWIRREACPSDKRGTVAVLTEAGYKALETAAPGHVEAVRQSLFDALTPDQVDQLIGICDAVLGKLDPDGTVRKARRAQE